VHDYHLLLAPKMIREALSSSNSNGHGVGEEVAQTGSKEEGGRLQKLGEKLGNVASNLGHSIGNANGKKDQKVNEIMIGMFMHTPWPSSEIFRCLPSE